MNAAVSFPIDFHIVSIDPPRFAISHKYHPGLISYYKTLPNRDYDYNTKEWVFPMASFVELCAAVHLRAPEGEITTFNAQFAVSLSESGITTGDNPRGTNEDVQVVSLTLCRLVHVLFAVI